ncbi:MAG: SprB repeat-containing protein, partial [Bacteroidetes bacterium]|nr:SprB repeat-containing protein [Bacteroidota bacterium]
MKQVAIITALLCTLLFNVHTAQAQTTLAVGDIIFTGYTGVPVAGVAPDTFKFVLLSPISSSTTIYFTERGYQNPGWQGSGGTEGTISWVSGSALPVGTEIMIAGLGGSAATINGIPNGTVAQISGGNATTGLSLSNAADQVIAFQGGGGDPSAGGVTFIAGISWHLNCGTTTDAGWNGSGCTYGAQSSAMPPGLTGGTNAFLAGTAGAAPNNDHGVFNCTGTPFSTLAAIRAAVMNKANWTFGGATNTSIVKISTSCTYYSTCVAPTVTSNPPNRSICVNGNTTFGATATGTGLTYQWQQNSGFGFTNISNGGVFSNATTSTLTISGATAGMNGYMYRVVVTGTCGTATSNAGTLSVSNITASTNQNNISCNGGANGSASVSPSGGISSYTYSWSPSGGTNATATGLSAGNYTVLITDAISCTASRTFTITQPPAINLSSWSQTNIACNGGSTGAASVTPSGGAGGYTYSWAPSGGTGSSATGLSAGSYTVQVTDANTCTASRTFNITQPSALVLNPASQTNIACFGGNTGAAAVSAATGGAGGYTYNWTPGNPTGDGTVSVTGLTAQTYTVVVTDANSCTASRTFNITQPAAAVSGTTVVTNVACFGGNTGAINLTPTGGQGPYTFSWAGGVTSEDRTSLTAGTYTVTIT